MLAARHRNEQEATVGPRDLAHVDNEKVNTEGGGVFLSRHGDVTFARLAMEEGNRETQALKLRNVRRRLFKDDEEAATIEPRGGADNEANRFMEEARENMQQAKDKWNFDFEKEEPLPGRYEWIKPDQDFPPDKSSPLAQQPHENSTNTGNSQLLKEIAGETS